MLNCEEIKQLLPKIDNGGIEDMQERDIDVLFNMDVNESQSKDFELQRVLQVYILNTRYILCFFNMTFSHFGGSFTLQELSWKVSLYSVSQIKQNES